MNRLLYDINLISTSWNIRANSWNSWAKNHQRKL